MAAQNPYVHLQELERRIDETTRKVQGFEVVTRNAGAFREAVNELSSRISALQGRMTEVERQQGNLVQQFAEVQHQVTMLRVQLMQQGGPRGNHD